MPHMIVLEGKRKSEEEEGKKKSNYLLSVISEPVCYHSTKTTTAVLCV